MKYRINALDSNWNRMEWFDAIPEEVKTFSSKEEAEEQISEWREMDDEVIHYSVEEV